MWILHLLFEVPNSGFSPWWFWIHSISFYVQLVRSLSNGTSEQKLLCTICTTGSPTFITEQLTSYSLNLEYPIWWLTFPKTILSQVCGGVCEYLQFLIWKTCYSGITICLNSTLYRQFIHSFSRYPTKSGKGLSADAGGGGCTTANVLYHNYFLDHNDMDGRHSFPSSLTQRTSRTHERRASSTQWICNCFPDF